MVSAKERIAQLTEDEWARYGSEYRRMGGNTLHAQVRLDAIEAYLDEISPGPAGSESRDDLSESAPGGSSSGAVAVGRPVASGEATPCWSCGALPLTREQIEALAAERAAQGDVNPSVENGADCQPDACGCDEAKSLREELLVAQQRIIDLTRQREHEYERAERFKRDFAALEAKHR